MPRHSIPPFYNQIAVKPVGCWIVAAAFAVPLTAADTPLSTLQKNCAKCHGASLQLSKLDLRTRESALQGGAHGPAIVPGKAEDSRLFRMISGLEKPVMPMGGSLDPAQIAVLKSWIDQGAPWDTTAAAPAQPSDMAALEDMPIPAEARNYWAFKLPQRYPVPAGAKNPIDAFLNRER